MSMDKCFFYLEKSLITLHEYVFLVTKKTYTYVNLASGYLCTTKRILEDDEMEMLLQQEGFTGIEINEGDIIKIHYDKTDLVYFAYGKNMDIESNLKIIKDVLLNVVNLNFNRLKIIKNNNVKSEPSVHNVLQESTVKECTCTHSFLNSDKGCTCGAIKPYQEY